MVNYLLYKIGQFIALLLPLKMSYKLAVFISDLHYIFAYKDRRSVKANLKMIFPNKPEQEICKIRKSIFRNFAKYLVDFFRFSKLDIEYIKRNVKIENIGYIDEALSKGKGVITLTAHIGNWELGGAVLALLGYPFWAVALPHKYKKVDNFFNSQRESKKIKVIPVGKAARLCLNVLRNNGIVALAGDRNFNEKGVATDFFGKSTYLPIGPAAFALKTGAAIVPGFMLRNKNDSFTLKFEKSLQLIPTDNISPSDVEGPDNDLAAITKRCKVIIEDYIRKYPDQWCMFRIF